MAKFCEICGKGPASGNNRSFSMRATRRRFLPNLQQVRMMEGGRSVRRKACTKCIKTTAKTRVTRTPAKAAG